MADEQPRPFKIDVGQESLDWVTQRVKTARIIPDAVELPADKKWDDGTPNATMVDLVDYWKNSFDWRKVEAKLNSTFKMFTVDFEEAGEVITLHFVHHPSERPDAIPLLFSHGWPGNFTEAESLLSLTAPEDPKQQAFHIIAPSIPGFVFSTPPKTPGFGILNIAEIYHKLMLKLGYSKYMCQGGDWGSMITRAIALKHPESCLALHLNMIVSTPPSPLQGPLVLLRLILRWLTPEEKKRLGRMQWWMKDEAGYSQIQGTKPQTVSYGLQDSPIGMLAWIREKLDSLVQPGYVWDKEQVITWTMLYLLSNSAWHGRIYKEAMKNVKAQVLDHVLSPTVAFGASFFPYEVFYIPKWWALASVSSNIVFWHEHDNGGHFPSVEVPDVFKADIWQFAKDLPESTRKALQSQSEVKA